MNKNKLIIKLSIDITVKDWDAAVKELKYYENLIKDTIGDNVIIHDGIISFEGYIDENK